MKTPTAAQKMAYWMTLPWVEPALCKERCEEFTSKGEACKNLPSYTYTRIDGLRTDCCTCHLPFMRGTQEAKRLVDWMVGNPPPWRLVLEEWKL